MAADNYFIADQFSLLSKLMDIHGENSFKAKSYAAAAFNIEKIAQPLASMPTDQISRLKGIGDSAAKKIQEILETGKLQVLEDLLQKTPEGILEMMQIKGLGPKKIASIWKEMEIESLGELLYACNENRLMRYKGFGEKTQANVKEAIEFYFKHQGSHLFAEVEAYAKAMDQLLHATFPSFHFAAAGPYYRQLPVIDHLEWISNADAGNLKAFFEKHNYQCKEEAPQTLVFTGAENIPLHFYLAENETAIAKLQFEHSASEAFLKACIDNPNWSKTSEAKSAGEIFSLLGSQPLPAYLRENPARLSQKEIPTCIQPADIKGIIHSHSDWSDGLYNIEEMAKACMEKQLEYLVISDHSKSAFYANGLNEERIKAQHQYIDELNEKYAPFRIFKSIECDILNDGSLDYTDKVLASFDLVIASVHSNLKMTEEKAMMRLLKAIENPYTFILGHMTGRLLLSRPGYPVNHHTIIDACAEHKVVIELNAHPRRLDIDWSHIEYAREKGVLISIDPDAHAIEGYDDCRYGVLVAQKAGLTAAANLSSFSREALTAFIAQRKKEKGIG